MSNDCVKNLIKDHLGVYVGHSTNKLIRKNSSSGGLVREIFEYLLTSGTVNGVLIVVQEYPKFFTTIARTVEEMSRMENSVYAPVNYAKGLKEMKEGEKYAVTAIGCQDEILKKVEHLIYFKIGFLCRGTYFPSTMEAYAAAFGHHSITNFAFRRNGWPGEIVVETKEGKYSYERRPSFIKSPRLRCTKEAFFSKATYLPKCVSCKYDFSFPSCDISLGDAWHKKYSSDTEGLTLAITRTELAENILKGLQKSGKFLYWRESEEETNNVMNDANIVSNLKLKNWMFKKTYTRPLMPILVFFEEYVLHFPWKVALKKITSNVSFIEKK
jgi:coenzyme F420 hydrogenase subunit beta